MKKFLSIVCIMGAVFMLVACSSKFTCATCGKESTGEKHEMGPKDARYVICDECYNIVKPLMK